MSVVFVLLMIFVFSLRVCLFVCLVLFPFCTLSACVPQQSTYGKTSLFVDRSEFPTRFTHSQWRAKDLVRISPPLSIGYYYIGVHSQEDDLVYITCLFEFDNLVRNPSISTVGYVFLLVFPICFSSVNLSSLPY